jgi:hypothetical protein
VEAAAVLTGDLVGSSEAGPEATTQAMTVLSATAGAIARWHDPSADPHFTRYRGDGWQTTLPDGSRGLRAALVMLAALAAQPHLPPTRVGIGIGAIATTGTRDLSDAVGPAFVAAGNALDKMGRSERLAIAGPGLLSLHQQVVGLLSDRVQRWTGPQADALGRYLHPASPSAADLASVFGISAQAIQYRLQSSGSVHLRRILRQWEDSFRHWQTTGIWT